MVSESSAKPPRRPGYIVDMESNIDKTAYLLEKERRNADELSLQLLEITDENSELEA